MRRGAHNRAVAAKMKLKALPATFSSVTPSLVAELLCLQSASASASEQVQKNKEVESMNPKPNIKKFQYLTVTRDRRERECYAPPHNTASMPSNARRKRKQCLRYKMLTPRPKMFF